MRACKHVTNFTSAHETNINEIGAARLSYPDNHIEADNRLSWLLGRLEQAYGDRAAYVHMTRDEDAVARSYLKRWKSEHSIIYGYRTTIVPNPSKQTPPIEIVKDFCKTVNSNVEQFLANKTRKVTVRLENAEEDFKKCWELAGFEGNQLAAFGEWKVPYNASLEDQPQGLAKVARIHKKLGRILKNLPDFIDRA